MWVPPPASRRAIIEAMVSMSAASVGRQIHSARLSKAITPKLSEGLSTSAEAMAASLASSILLPPIEPDLSITSISARLGFSTFLRIGMRTGRASSTGVR